MSGPNNCMDLNDSVVETPWIDNNKEVWALNDAITDYIGVCCNREVVALVRDNKQQLINRGKSGIEVAGYQLEKLVEYLDGKVKALRELIHSLTEENKQLKLDNKRKTETIRTADELLFPVQEENESLREILNKKGVTKNTIEWLVGEKESQEKQDLNRALNHIQDLKVQIRQI